MSASLALVQHAPAHPCLQPGMGAGSHTSSCLHCGARLCFHGMPGSVLAAGCCLLSWGAVGCMPGSKWLLQVGFGVLFFAKIPVNSDPSLNLTEEQIMSG